MEVMRCRFLGILGIEKDMRLDRWIVGIEDALKYLYTVNQLLFQASPTMSKSKDTASHLPI